MSDLSNSSFIPKQNPTKALRRTSSRQVYVFSLISYVLLAASLIATAGVYLYDHYAKRALNQEISELNAAIQDFSESDMRQVIALDERIKATKSQLERNISLEGVLRAIEESTIDTVTVNSMSLARAEANEIKIDATLTTDSFDSVLFQRKIYELASTSLASSTLSNVAITLASAGAGEASSGEQSVSLSALFTIDPLTVPFDPIESRDIRFSTSTTTSSVRVIPPAPATTTATSS